MKNSSLLAGVVLATTAACGGGNNPDAGRDIQRLEGGNNTISISPSSAFEGQRRFVGSIGPSRGADDLTNATITTPMGSPIVIDSFQCNRIRCGVVGHIEDTRPNVGAAIPEPTSGMPSNINVAGAMLNYSAALQIFPLDTADAAALGSGQVTSDALYSTLSIEAGRTLRGATPERPVRFAVMNRAEVHGTFDLSATGATQGAGGHAGGEAPAGDGQGPFPGIGNAAAGGGGGNAEAGTAGAGEGGAAGGAGGMANPDTLLAQLRGGSGGGASMTGAGGGGGGGMLLALFGGGDLSGAQFVVRGGDGMNGGGGGAGGAIILGGEATGSFTVDISGGAGGTSGAARGGTGSVGRLRVDGAFPGLAVTGGAASSGVRVDLASVPPIVRDALLTITGTAPANTRVRIQNEINGVTSGPRETMAGADGRWTLEYTLQPGAATLVAYAVTGTTAVPSLSGTTVIVRGAAGARQIHAGAIDVVYVPMEE